MKQRILLLLLPLLMALGAKAQVTLQSESFEGTSAGYTTNGFNQGSVTTVNGAQATATQSNNAYFQRVTATSTTSPPNTLPTTNWPLNPVTGPGLHGSYFWAGESVRGPANVYDRAPGFVALNAVSVAGYRNLQVKVAFLDARYTASSVNWEPLDTLKVQVRFDGAGPWATIGQFTSDQYASANAGHLRQDVNLDGKANDDLTAGSPLVTNSMTDFTFPVFATGSTMQTRVVASEEGLSEEFGFDNIRVLGTAFSTAAPVLSSIESGTLNYPTANASVAITSTLTVSDADNTTLSSAVVRFAQIKDAVNDVLSFAGTAATGNIAGSFSTSTRQLTLTSAGSTATMAQWQAALRLVKFQTNVGISAAGNNRSVLFTVTDPTGNVSNSAFRTVGYAPATAPSVTTDAASAVASTSAVLGGNITADGGASLTERGVVYVVGTGTPTTANTKALVLTSGVTTGTFSGTVSGLTPSTQYTVSAYAINSVGTSYGSPVTFTTAAPVSGTTVVTNVSCFGGSTGAINLTPSGGVAPYTFNWGGGITTEDRTGLTAGTYSVTITDAFGATGTVSNIAVGQPTAPVSGSTVVTNVSCFGGSNGAINLTPSGGTGPYTYNWGNGITTEDRTGLTAGTYSVQITDNNGCTSTINNITISQPTAPVGGSTVVTNVSCFGGNNGTINLTPSGGTGPYSFLWNNGATTEDRTGLTAGTYSVQITDVNGCTGTLINIAVTQPTSPVSGSTVVTNVACFGGSNGAINLTPSGGTGPYSFLWNNGATTEDRTGLTAGTYSVQITDVNGCTGTVSNIAITQPASALAATAASQTNVSTPGGSDGAATVSVSGGTPGYTYDWTPGTPTGDGTASVSNLSAGTYSVTVTDANGCTASRSFTITEPTTVTVTGVTRQNPSPAATATVSYAVTFSGNVSGLSTSNFALTTTGAVSGASVSSVSGSGSTYTVTVNTGSGDGTLRLDLANNTGISPTVTNTPFTTGQVYTIIKAFTNPVLTIQAAGSLSGGSDVTAFVDMVQVLEGGNPFANALQNASFETHGPLGNGNYGYNPGGASWTFNGRSGIARNGSNFGAPNAPDGTAVAFVQSNSGNGMLQQGLALPTGSYQVRFQTSQRTCCTTMDQQLNVFVNGVFVGGILPTNTGGYQTFTSDAFSVTAPDLTASISSTAGSPTSTSPIPVTVTFSQAVTGFTLGDVVVTNGTASGLSGSGSTYSFNVTPAGNGTVTVDVPAGAATDANNTTNSAAPQFSIIYSTMTAWTGAVSTDWYTAANWSNGVPTATLDGLIVGGAPRYPLIAAGTASVRGLTLGDSASLTQTGGTLSVRSTWINDGTYTATGGTVALTSVGGQMVGGSSLNRFWNLTVNSAGATLSSSASVRRLLTLNGNLATSGQTFTLESTPTLSAMVVNNGGVVTGTATVQRAIDSSLNSGPGYRHYSSPVVSTTVADLATPGFTPVVNPAYNTSPAPTSVTPFPNVFGYDQSRLTLTNNLVGFDKGWFSPASLTDVLQQGRGYTVNINASETVDFVGSLFTGTLPLSLARNSGATAPDAGWNFVGNPYASPLNWSLIAPADRVNLDGSMYVYQSTSQYGGQYRAYVNGIGGDPRVPVAGGFWVRVSSGQTAGTLTLRNSQRLTAYANVGLQRGTVDTRPLVQLDLLGAQGLTDAAYVYFESGATAGVDADFDAVKLPNTTGLNLAAVAAGQELSINGLPGLGAAELTVPLTVKVPATGSYTLQAAQLANLAGAHAYLRDRQTGALVDLQAQPSYTFTLNAANNTPRFELVFSPQRVLGTASASLSAQVAVYPNPAAKTVFVELPAAVGRKAVTAELVDALGRVVRTQALPAAGATAHKLSLVGVATGVYSVRISTPQGVVVKKLVVE